MHILTAIHFNAPHGGLHDNVFSTVKQSIDRGHRATVVCKDGEFAERIKNIGAQVITTDYESIEDTVESVLNAQKNDYDVIHTHPGPSRKVALSISEVTSAPLFMTFHGMWRDSLGRYADKLSAIFPVSEGVKDFIKGNLDAHYEKMIVMPNGANKKIYKPKKELFGIRKATNKPLNISLISRFDRDKDFIIQLYYKALKYTSDNYPGEIKWTIVGDGSDLQEMKKRSNSIDSESEKNVEFVGWKTGKDLLKCYQESDIVIAPGRCALEAMSCGKPVIAIGSKKYNGLVNNSNWLQGVYTNFGGFGNKMDDYIEGSIEKELQSVIEDESYRKKLGDLGIYITDQFYNEEVINDKIIGVYKLFAGGGY